MLSGIAPTGRYVELPHVVVIKFEDDKVAQEHIYWDQALLLAQIGLLEENLLPVVGAVRRRCCRRCRPRNGAGAHGRAPHAKRRIILVVNAYRGAPTRLSSA